MDIAVEISLYPLREEFIPAIEDFIDRLNTHAGIKVVTTSMSTQISGEYTLIVAALTAEMRRSFEAGGKAVFVMKVLGPLASA